MALAHSQYTHLHTPPRVNPQSYLPAGATINVLTKSGSNQWHGSLYDFLRNDKLDAKNYFVPSTTVKPPFRQNQFGGSLGGKIVPDKLFFFANYEGFRRSQARTLLNTVPTLEMRSGNFTNVRDIFDPSMIQAYPAAQTGALTNNYTAVLKEKQKWDQADGRVDWNWNEKNTVFGRYSQQNTVTSRPPTFPNSRVPGFHQLLGLGNEDTFAGNSTLHSFHAAASWIRTMNFRSLMISLAGASIAMADVEIPSGTKVSCRLEQTLSSATAEEGMPVQLPVTENIMVNGAVVIPQGSSVQGAIIQATAKRRMGRTGKLDFSIDKVRAVDGQYVPLRYSLHKKEGGSNTVRTGVLTAGAAVLFWPAAPFLLLSKGKDATINKGMVLDVFTDQAHNVRTMPAQPSQAQMSELAPANHPAASGGMAPVTITADQKGAEVEIDAAFVGSAPSTRRLTAGLHKIAVRQDGRVWERVIQVQAGDSLTVHATLGGPRDPALAKRPAGGNR